jgi:hypothetical protein
MPSEPSSDSKFEIGHVLFIDVVGYSKLLIEDQKERLGQLTKIVLGTAQVRDSSDEQLVGLPTGDGMALVFRHSAISYRYLRRDAEAIAALDRASAIVPDNVETRTARGLYYLCWKGDTRPLHQTIDAILAQGPGAIANAADIWFFCALAERDPAAAERALVALGDNPCWGESTIILSRSFGEGLLARMTKDEARARTALEAARVQQEKIVQAQPDYGPTLCVLGLIDAALGRKTWPWTKAVERSHSCRWKKISSTAASSFSISPLQQRGRARRSSPCSNWKLGCVLPPQRSC